ncbi:hypothetical protein [Devosia faecipullorum]|uniref:hypothetical protein n=1 Tax=Devosia faecipullorum TaxID=2755039 RepID=UPI00187B55C8|nr:hypothetical protein [Devosia faecipullorum]MBE7732579.1 hypothetical protein [Devosia faecipullorum]
MGFRCLGVSGSDFKFSWRGVEARLRIGEGIVCDEFIALGREADRMAAEDERLEWLKQDMASRLLALPGGDVYDVCQPGRSTLAVC